MQRRRRVERVGVDAEWIARKLAVIQIVAVAAGPVGMVGGQAIDLASVKPDPQGRLLPQLDAEGPTLTVQLS